MAKKYKIEKSEKKTKWNLTTSDNTTESELVSSSRIEIVGNCELTLEGCQGVVEYTDSYMKLKLKKGTLILCGNDFDITLFENKRLSLRGKISSVEFCV